MLGVCHVVFPVAITHRGQKAGKFPWTYPLILVNVEVFKKREGDFPFAPEQHGVGRDGQHGARKSRAAARSSLAGKMWHS